MQFSQRPGFGLRCLSTGAGRFLYSQWSVSQRTFPWSATSEASKSSNPGQESGSLIHEVQIDVCESRRSALVLRLRSDWELGNSVSSLSVQRLDCRESSHPTTSRWYSHAVQTYRGQSKSRMTWCDSARTLALSPAEFRNAFSSDVGHRVVRGGRDKKGGTFRPAIFAF